MNNVSLRGKWKKLWRSNSK